MFGQKKFYQTRKNASFSTNEIFKPILKFEIMKNMLIFLIHLFFSL